VAAASSSADRTAKAIDGQVSRLPPFHSPFSRTALVTQHSIPSSPPPSCATLSCPANKLSGTSFESHVSVCVCADDAAR